MSPFDVVAVGTHGGRGETIIKIPDEAATVSRTRQVTLGIMSYRIAVDGLDFMGSRMSPIFGRTIFGYRVPITDRRQAPRSVHAPIRTTPERQTPQINFPSFDFGRGRLRPPQSLACACHWIRLGRSRALPACDHPREGKAPSAPIAGLRLSLDSAWAEPRPPNNQGASGSIIQTGTTLEQTNKEDSAAIYTRSFENAPRAAARETKSSTSFTLSSRYAYRVQMTRSRWQCDSSHVPSLVRSDAKQTVVFGEG